ncbi:MAG: DUF1294 domain-containing protein [Acutalibacteraceae bacterium]|nr:DUF1294 domain-containing protein [Acutalibacteraceae bacterium]
MDKLISVLSSSFEQMLPLLCIYVVIGAFSVIITVYDKSAARKRRKRIPENFLMFTAICGGAIPMLITMKSIRHKIQHNKFMLGLPAIILIHLIGVIALMYVKYC